jgi:type I restriction enzyme R subunit
MVVTRGRLHAVRYKQAFDKCLKELGYPIKALVAFSGTVTDESSGLDYTEAEMNGFADTQTATQFKRPEYRFLIVAEKYQTGFDQPLLHTMYVDKQLSGVAAVQTLSRLNRIHPGKTETMVLDFANRAEDIQEAFAPYYETTVLSEGTDPNKLYDLQAALAEYQLYEESEVAEIGQLFLTKGERAANLQPLLRAIVTRFQYIAEPDRRGRFKHHLRTYIRLYAFLSQVIPFRDADLERLYLFARLLLRALPPEQERLPLAIRETIDLESYRVQQINTGSLLLQQGAGTLDPLADLGTSALTVAEQAALSQIIAEINQRFGTTFTDADRVFFAELKTRLAANESLQASARVNSRGNVQLLHDTLFKRVLQSMIDNNFDLFKRINDDPVFGDEVRRLIFEQVYQDLVNRLGSGSEKEPAS